MNFSGNVGKSTISRHLFLTRLENANLIPIESINSDGSEDEQFRGNQFGELLKSLPYFDNAIIDVGASNVEDFINLMRKYDGSHEHFDLFVIPTVSKRKQINDTISTIATLNEIGVPAEKIVVVFNMVEDTEEIEKTFESLFKYHAKEKAFILKRKAVIHENELFVNLKDSSTSVDDLLNDETDYKALMAATPDKTEKVRLMHHLANRMLAKTVKKELDAVFTVLVG